MIEETEMRWAFLTSFERDLLEGLAYVEATEDIPDGPAVKREMQLRYGGEVDAGRLYANLDGLAAYGLVEKKSYDRRTNAYVLTTHARKMMRERAARLGEAAGLPPASIATDGGERA